MIWFSLTGFVIFYTVLFVVDVFLMVKYVRQGPQPPAGRRRLLASPDGVTERLPGAPDPAQGAPAE